MDIIVVEGTHDEIRVKSAIPGASCIITNGSEISDSTIELIKKMSEGNRIIIFTDPDSPGEKIRKTIHEAVPSASDAFLRKKDCISHNKRKVGIEHATNEDIRLALGEIHTPSDLPDTITVKDLFALGLNGGADSAALRNKISDILNIGRPNAKLFLKRLNLLQVTKEELEELLCRVKSEMQPL